MTGNNELIAIMDDLFRHYKIKLVKKIKIINHKYDGCTVTLHMESGRNVGCRLEYHTDNDVIAWIKERYDIADVQKYAYDAETLVTTMMVREK